MNNDFQLPKWQKIDLHIHSPYSCIKKGESELLDYYIEKGISLELNDDKIEIWKNDLLDLIVEKELNIISISDHNFFSSKLFSEISNELINKKINCIVLPSVELDLIFDNSNVHFLMIFNDKLEYDKYNAIEENIKYLYDDKKNIKLLDLIKTFLKFEYILIPHSERKDNGLQITDDNSNMIDELIRNLIIPSLEGNEKMASKYEENILSTSRKFNDYVIPSFVHFSDNHNLKKYTMEKSTYIKTTLCFNGLKLSLLAHNKRLKISKEFPKEIYMNKIKYVTYDLTRNYDKEKINGKLFLSENLTTIIGNRSSGKSLILHACFDNQENKKTKHDSYFGNSPKLFKNTKDIKFYNFKNEEYPFEWVKKNVKFYEQDELIRSFFTSSIFRDYNYLFKSEFDNVFESKKNLIKNSIDHICSSSAQISEIINSKINNESLFNELNDKIYIIQNEYNDQIETNIENIKNIEKYISYIEQIINDFTLLEIDDNEIIFLESLLKKFRDKSNLLKNKNILYSSLKKAQTIFSEVNRENILGKIIEDLSIAKNIYNEMQSIISNKNSFETYYDNSFNINKKRKYVFRKIHINEINNNTIIKIIKDNCGDDLNFEELNILDIYNKISSIDAKNIDLWINNNLEFKYEIIFKDDSGNEECINNMSEGRKALAILEVLLSKENEKYNVLVIDQPEDNVDNNDIFKVICQNLLHNSDKQIIFSTHNANIVVNGDSELITFANKESKNFNIEQYILEDDRSHEKICEILEGGKTAFHKRGIRYDIKWK